MDLKVLALVLAGGKGTRLAPLTAERAKPAVPFGGKYRIIDFVLSNLINSGIYSIYVLIQFRSQSLLQHLRDGWQFGGMLQNQFIIPVPAQMRSAGETWYSGTADAVYQNFNLIEQSAPDIVVLFGADHIYRMDVRQMIRYHRDKGAGVTISALPVEKKFAKDFGVIEIDEDGRILAFHEKKPDAPTMPGNPEMVLASMGNYIFERELLLDLVGKDAADPQSSHDFGTNILPRLVDSVPMYAYDFQTNHIAGDPPGGTPYWRDVGTLDAYYESNMDMRAIDPPLNLYNRNWPLRTAGYSDPPAKFAFDEENRRGEAIDSILSGGCILSGGVVRRSVLGRHVFVHSYAQVEDCIVFDNVDIGRRCKIRRAIIEKNVRIPPDTVIGYDAEEDRKRYQVTESGLVVIKGERSPVPLSSLSI
ncbi:Glucose-1-phosphate adenylyltransferase [Caenispirillum salinarum AK4]|uniref:Glucose-1-phosphate adenylyltransferase n=1 Tax=Caenispirillum salinarum AK4 TaxID=1238182 RepID=K9HRM1_9PROT|nr:glucose-1-phosphate adenylyltransferase [Caenispirillum salinarum]EKV32943.1 Glucose-1-phosphate adenylyltransferase [Caenispirillum salinarum AK4]